MMHKGNNTRSRTVAKGICAGSSKNYYKGLVQVHSKVKNLTNSLQCDSAYWGQCNCQYLSLHPGFAFSFLVFMCVEYMYNFKRRGVSW